MKTSNLFSLNWNDLAKGFLVAALTAFLATVSLSINEGHLPTLVDLKTAGLGGLVAGIAYLIKNFLTPPSVVTPIQKTVDPNDQK